MVITASDIDLQGSLTSGSGVLTLMTKASGTTIGLGSSTQQCTISGTELQRMTTTGGLVIGDKVRSGAVVVDGVTAANSAHVSSVYLKSYGNTTLSTTRSYFKAATLDSAAGININTDLDTNTGALVLTSQSSTFAGGVTLTAGTTLSSTVAGGGHTASAAGDLNLVATNAPAGAFGVEVVNGLTVATGSTLSVDTTGFFSVSGSAPISSSNASLVVCVGSCRGLSGASGEGQRCRPEHHVHSIVDR